MKVELLQVFGDDNMVVDVARVSYNKSSENYTEEQNDRLVRFLAREGHWSPASHPQLQFRLTIPIYVERQLVKSESGRVYNSISGRYVDFSDTYTKIPYGGWRKQSKSSKQGSDGLLDEEGQRLANNIQSDVEVVVRDAYKKLIDLGVSKEQARTILALNLNTTMIWTGSLYTLIRLCNQRIKDDAQRETRVVVEKMLEEVKKTGKFDKTLKAYGYG